MKNFINIIAMGQGGSRISSVFERAGVFASYCNTDEIDFRGLQIPEENKLCFSGTGTGCSLLKGRELIERHKDEFFGFIESHLDPQKLNLFVFCLGGGSGGSMALEAIPFAISKKYRVGVLTVLPPKMLGMLTSDNALRVLRQLREIKGIQTFLLGDNEYILSKVGFKKDWWAGVNQYIFTLVSSIFEIIRTGKTSQSGIGSIDKGELMRILQYGNGSIDVRVHYLNNSEIDSGISDETLLEKLYAPQMIEGYKYNNTLAYIVNIDTPKSGDYTSIVKQIFSVSEKLSGSAISRLGMFIDPMLTDSIRVTMVNAGLKLPKVIVNRINGLTKDERKFSTKKSKEDKTDFSKVENSFLDEEFDI
jgi:cell division GTPase FtsZ